MEPEKSGRSPGKGVRRVWAGKWQWEWREEWAKDIAASL